MQEAEGKLELVEDVFERRFKPRLVVRLEQYPNDAVWLAAGYLPARLAIAGGDKKAAAKQLRGVYERAMEEDAQGLAIRIRVYQSLAAQTPDEAVDFLADALRIGEPEGFIRTFLDEGKLLRPLLARAIAKGVSVRYASRLVGIIDSEESRIRARTAPDPKRGGLSERELEILLLISAGLSNRQIAERLFITLSTAKTHVHHISEKVGARTRTQILARSKEMKLI